MLGISNEKLINFIKKEIILVIAVILAILSSFFATPKLEYIDFKVLILLFNLMIVVAGLKAFNVLDWVAMLFLKKCQSSRKIVFVLVTITFIASMFITNDVALITFVRFALIIGNKINESMLKIVVLQTLAANLGSSFTPMGNPQNLFVYTTYGMNFQDFFSVTVPLVGVSIIFLLVIMLKDDNRKIDFELETIKLLEKKKISILSVLFVSILLSVFHLIDYRMVFVITLFLTFFIDKTLFSKVDYSLLFTFIGFFIFIGNLSSMTWVKCLMEKLLNTRESTYLLSVLTSQVISNVPATILLSGFTGFKKALLMGVNIGGMGTLIASMASVISYKLYMEEYKEESKKYIITFSLYNLLGLLIFVPLFYLYITL